MPTEGWYTRSVRDCPVQIYDNEDRGWRAILNTDTGRIRVYRLESSRIVPVIDSMPGSNWAETAILEAVA